MDTKEFCLGMLARAENKTRKSNPNTAPEQHHDWDLGWQVGHVFHSVSPLKENLLLTVHNRLNALEPLFPNISLKAPYREQVLIKKIAKAYCVAVGYPPEEQVAVEMDITACHLNGCPLRLRGLSECNPGHLAHDVSGIRGTLDRTTGKLTGTFHPRFAA